MNKQIVLAGDFNLNVQDFENNKKVENFINLMFRYGMIPTINKPTRVAASTATSINHIKTNIIIDTDFKTRISKNCISDHFVVMQAFPTGEKKMCNKLEQHIHWLIFNETLIESFYNEFLGTFTSLYCDCFPRLKVKVKVRNSFQPWITKGIAESSKKKQNLYEKYLELQPSTLSHVYNI